MVGNYLVILSRKTKVEGNLEVILEKFVNMLVGVNALYVRVNVVKLPNQITQYKTYAQPEHKFTPGKSTTLCRITLGFIGLH